MIKIFNLDCMDYMAGIEDKSFDLGSGDPPYFKGLGKMGYFGRVNSSIGVKRGSYSVPLWDADIPTEAYFHELKRISKDQIIWGANYFDFIGPVHATPRRADLQEWIDSHPTGWIVWDKINGDTAFNDFELAWTSFDMPTIVFKFMWNGMIQGINLSQPTTMQGNKKKNEKRIHPTQKPVPLYDWQFRLQQIKSVFETHGGSFSAAVSAYRLNLDMVITEKDNRCFLSGQKRFNQYTAQQKLFN